MKELSEIVFRPIFEGILRCGIDATAKWIFAGNADAVMVRDGRSIARYGRRLIIAVAGCTGMFAAVTLLVLLAAPGHAKWIAAPFALFMLLGVQCLLDCIYTRFEFNRQELVVRTFWKGRQLIPWPAVQSLGYSRMGYRQIHAGAYGDIGISNYLAGSKALIDLIRAKVQERKATARY